MTTRDRHRALFPQFVELLLRPIAKFCIRRSIGFQTFVAVGKRVFVDVAQGEPVLHAGRESAKLRPLNRSGRFRCHRRVQPDAGGEIGVGQLVLGIPEPENGEWHVDTT